MKTRDYTKTFRGLGADAGVCRVRLYEDLDEEPSGAETSQTFRQGPESPIVVISDPPENTNTSVTNIAEFLFAEVAEELGVVWADTRFMEHYPRTESQLRCGIPEGFSLVTFSAFENAVAGFVEMRRVSVGGVMRPTFGMPDWQHLSRKEVAKLLGVDLGGEIVPEPEEPEKAESTTLGPGEARAGEHGMDLSLNWEGPNGDIILRRVPDFDRGLDLADHLQSILQTNVAWSVVHHSPSGFEFGYGGSGPADLSLNILNMFCPPGEDGLPPVRCFEGAASRTAWDLHQRFKSTFIAPLERFADHVLSGAEIRKWIEAIQEQRKAS